MPLTIKKRVIPKPANQASKNIIFIGKFWDLIMSDMTWPVVFIPASSSSSFIRLYLVDILNIFVNFFVRKIRKISN